MQPSSGDQMWPHDVSNVVRGAVSGVVVQAGTANFTLPSPAPRARSRYQQYVLQRIAPVQLLERDEELRQIAQFCTSLNASNSYLWVRAEAWSGKSALMSWFALHPPAGVRVVSFFVTARLANQNDRAAFVDNVLQQLLDLLDEEQPALMTDTTRESHLAGLIDDAAERCAERGERLVLLVDGLDEDRGAETHSIAGLLPAAPCAGMRVVVASRPNPPIPSDVAQNHPLREPAIVAALTRSPHADTAREQMERELKALYKGEPGERDLLGLVTAAGGGLSAADLAELAGASEWDVEDLLATVAGRSFTKRESQSRPVYLLGHEELQVAARGMFGAQRIADYRQRLHRWADDYRERCWPEGTPEYLLQGYFNMLSAAGEVVRMVQCATDAQRQDRMLDVFGGDALAMEELASAQSALGSRTPVDVPALTRMAVHRDFLLGRNSNIPTNLPALWAVLGQINRAELIAHSFNKGFDRARALTRLAVVLQRSAASVRTENVVAAARESIGVVPAADERAQLLASLSGNDQRAEDDATRLSLTTASAIHACCAAGAYERASRLAAQVTDPSERSAVVSTAVQTLLEERRLDRTAVRRRLFPDEWFSDTEIILTTRLLPAGPPEVGELADGLSELDAHNADRVSLIRAEIAALRTSLHQEDATTSVVRACIALGEVELAARLLRSIEDRSRARLNVLGHRDVQRCMARAGVRTGRLDIVKEMLGYAELDDHSTAIRLLEAMAEASDLDSLHLDHRERVVRGALDALEVGRIRAIARDVPETSSRVRAITGILRYTIDAGDLKSASALVELASALAGSTRPRGEAVERLVAVAVEAARANLSGEALALVEKARDLARAERFSAAGHGPLLVEVAGAAAEIGATDLAGRLLLEANHVRHQLSGSAESVLSFALLAHRVGQTDLAESCLRRTERTANAENNDASRARWLARTAQAWTEIGEISVSRRLMAEAEAVADAAESIQARERIHALISNVVVDARAFQRVGISSEEARVVLARLLQETSWMLVIDDLALDDDGVLDVVVHELFVVANRS